MIKRIINKAFKIMYGFLPKKKYIVFESEPQLSDNTLAVYNEMLKRRINENYKLIWWVSDQNNEIPKYENVIYINEKNRNFKKYLRNAKILISCNKFLTSNGPFQKAFYLGHGIGIKCTRNYFLPKGINYVLCDSDKSCDIMHKNYKGNRSKYYPLGFPRNDMLYRKIDLYKILKKKYKKIIMWYPTFRQHKNGTKTDCVNPLPILKSTEIVEKINKVLKKHNILLICKPHFAQDISYIQNYNISNILFINDDFFKENHISAYEFLGNCDALLTDYSSVYFDYLLCDKPIGAIWEDIEQYRKNPGFIIDESYYMKGAVKIYNVEDFISFIVDLSNNVDKFKEERKEISMIMNFNHDDKNAKRVVDFIIKKGNIK